ncbi:MlaE family lipid ABC transporter permease subunit [Nitratifractor sp.]
MEVRKNGNEIIISCLGDWTVYRSHLLEKELRKIRIEGERSCVVDFHGVKQFDSAGILLLLELMDLLHKRGNRCTLEGVSEKQRKMMQLLQRGYSKKPLPRRETGLLHRIGKSAVEEYRTLLAFLRFFGELSVSFFRLFLQPKNFRFKETVYHIEHSGLDALFIIGLTSFLVGLVIAYESLVQLSQFGADIYVVDGIGIAITRELGPMITAIVIAGRSASSYAAEIGTMKITEEIAAMRTMGFDPFFFLVIPRILALIIALPLLIFFSDIIGILGGMIASKFQVDISFSFFIQRLQEVLDAKHYILGLVKAPFFAFIIAATGCFHGFRVTGNTESIGIETTASVVHAIFFVIACDALFAVIFTQLGY